MKKLKILPSILMLVLCVGVLAVGVFAITPTQNTISGSISINATAQEVEMQMFVDGKAKTNVETIRGGKPWNFGELEFYLDNANEVWEVGYVDVVFTIKNKATATTTAEKSAKALGAYFAYKDTAKPTQYATASHVAIEDTIQNEEKTITYVTIKMSSYTAILPGETVEMTMRFFLESFEVLDNYELNYQLFIEPYHAEETADGLFKLPITDTTILSYSTFTDTQRSAMKYVCIPSSYNSWGEPVSIDSPPGKGGAFVGSNMNSITVPESFTEIGAYSLAGCYNMNYMFFPKSIETVKTCALQDTIFTSLRVDFPIDGNLTTLEEWAFYDHFIFTLPNTVQNFALFSLGSLYVTTGTTKLSKIFIEQGGVDISEILVQDFDSGFIKPVKQSMVNTGKYIFDYYEVVSFDEVSIYGLTSEQQQICLNSGWTDTSLYDYNTNNGECVYMLWPRENRQPVSSIIPKELHGLTFSNDTGSLFDKYIIDIFSDNSTTRLYVR